MTNLMLLYGYNNYYNRIMKREESVAAYVTAAGSYFELTSTNFNPGDGLSAVHTFNFSTETTSEPDYLIVYDPSTLNILSRWFVLETKRNRKLQIQVTLTRDVIADNLNAILDSPVFIEKAKLRNDDPQIFNLENMDVNQIKVGEYLLENNLKTPWLVAYLARKDGNGNYLNFNQTFKIDLDELVDQEYAGISSYPYYALRNANKVVESWSLRFGIGYFKFVNNNLTGMYKAGWNSVFIENNAGSIVDTIPSVAALTFDTSSQNYWPDYNIQNLRRYQDIKTVYDTFTTNGVNSATGMLTPDFAETLKAENGKIIKDTLTNKYYRIQVSSTSSNQTQHFQVSNLPHSNYVPTLHNAIKNIKDDFVGIVFDTEYNENQIYTFVETIGNHTELQLSLIEMTNANSFTYNFTYTKDFTKDAPYEIIAAPLNTKTFHYTDENNNVVDINSFAAATMAWFNNLAESYHGTYLYDVQILPYIFMDQEAIDNFSYILLTTTDAPNTPVGIAFKIPAASFTKTINKTITLDEDWKVGSNTELYRLTSPNGVANFDFSPYKNGGVSIFEIDCTLIPYTPYLKINPLFGNLYGGDYNDYRGLICSGDFSIAIVSDQWANYANNNKYYQQIFDRQIESMEVQNKYQRIKEGIGIAQGAISGGMSGAIMGSAGGPIGMVAGAAIGGTLSVASGIGDMVMAEELRKENLDYTKDQFGYSLQTVKARADTLTRSTSYNINNKYFPYIEKFDCTEIEKEAFRKKIQYNGMTVMRIGYMRNYLWENEKTYIKGQLVRCENLIVDFHTLNRIQEELNKGVFI